METLHLRSKTGGLHLLFMSQWTRVPLLAMMTFILGICQPQSLSAQPDSLSFLMSGGLNDIMDKKPEPGLSDNISVASLFESNIYEAPGIITVITEEDIKAGGYRDILDLLNQIPGFSIASDVQNGISFGIRGNWAEEAKLLVLLDGMPINEMSYGTFAFGHRLDLVNVKRIEVIRGAGSSKYGGAAALGVINIITKQGQEISGHRLAAGTGFSGGTFSRNELSYNYGGLLPNNVELTTSGSLSEGNLSNMSITIPDSTRVRLCDSSNINNARIYLSIKYKTLKFKQLFENHTFQSTYEPIFSLNRTTFSELEKQFIGRHADLSCSVNYKFQIPWNTLYGDPKEYDAQNLITSRILAGATLKTKWRAPYQLIFGLNGYNDHMRHQRRAKTLSTGRLSENYQGVSAFAEFMLNSKLVNLNLGMRFENYAYFEPNFAPRITLTKKFQNWHYKLIYNRAYKLPALQNINLDVEQAIVPEKIQEAQAQLGWGMKKFSITATYYNIRIEDLIVYGYDNSTKLEWYFNSGDLNNHGVELETSFKAKHIKLEASYSYNRLMNSSVPEIMRDTANPSAGTLALPNHKIVARLSAKINPRTSFNLQYIFESNKESVVQTNKTDTTYEQVLFPATHNVNLVMNFDKVIWNAVDVSFGVYNILGRELTYLYSFNSGYQPLVGMGRDFRLHVKIRF